MGSSHSAGTRPYRTAPSSDGSCSIDCIQSQGIAIWAITPGASSFHRWRSIVSTAAVGNSRRVRGIGQAKRGSLLRHSPVRSPRRGRLFGDPARTTAKPSGINKGGSARSICEPAPPR